MKMTKEEFAKAMDEIKAAALADIEEARINMSREILETGEPDRNRPYEAGGPIWKRYVAGNIVTVTITVSMPPSGK